VRQRRLRRNFLAALDEAGIATALVTNSSTTAQLANLEAVGPATAFDAVVISGQSRTHQYSDGRSMGYT
jgi:FMN phosphatase YigB (HAD superfamily)